MKTQFLHKAATALIFSLSLAPVFSQQHPKGFDIKKHKDTILSKPNLQTPSRAFSKISPATGAVAGSRKSLANVFTGSKANLRQDESKVIFSDATGLPLFISTPSNPTARIEANSDKAKATMVYLQALNSYLKLNAATDNFSVQEIITENSGKSHVKVSQKYKGIKVYDAHAIVHLGATGVGEAFNGRYQLIKKELDIQPRISPQIALEKVISDLSGKTKVRQLTNIEKELLEYTSPQTDTIIYTVKEPVLTHLLAYHISIRPNLMEHWEYFINARNGAVIKAFQNTCGADGTRKATGTDLNGVSRSLDTYQEGNNFLMVDASQAMFDATTSEGAIVTVDANKTFGKNFKVQDISSPNNQWLSPAAVSAHYNSHIAYQFFKDTYGRNSINGKGGSIISVINVVDEDGSALDNAYWSGKAMFYGNGNTSFKSLAGGLDVGGHEMTHGVVQNTANLEYQGESGAINESMADVFGSMMDPEDWQIGEDVVNKQIFKSGALRSLQDPHNGGNTIFDPGYQPAHVNEQFRGADDNGGVHINSGIPNHAFYLLATGIGRQKAGAIFYRALSTYLTQNAQFIDLRIAVIQSAKDLYTASGPEAVQAGIAFDNVGISEKTGGVYTTTLPVNPGSEYLLVYSTDTDDENGLYRTTDAPSAEALLEKVVNSKPSVTDDGNYCVFVGTDKKIYVSEINPSGTGQTFLLQQDAIWSNAAISKDGNRLAAITLDKDTSIYVFDLEKDNSYQRFALYNPTFSDLKAGGVLYADAIEWDYSGERLVYDAFNTIQNSDGDNIEYWDINFIQVYDAARKTYGDGTVFKLISGLEEGESIGNPSFSKTSPHIIAFDYVNESDPQNVVYGIIGYNAELNKIDGIVNNNTLGFPSYSKDDKLLSFTYDDQNGVTSTGKVVMNADKISSNGNLIEIFRDTKWPVYFATGNRDYTTGTEDQLMSSASLAIFPNPARDFLTVKLPEVTGAAQQITIYNSMGVEVIKQNSVPEGQTQIQLSITNLPSGVYTLLVQQRNAQTSTRFVKY